MTLSVLSSVNFTESRQTNYKALMPSLLALPACTLITTGRTGTDFLQSLLDSHPHVLTFNGVFHYHDFWANSKCVNCGRFDLSDFLDEFIGHHIEKFKSKYDLQERKDQLGESRDQSLDIDLVRFKQTAIDLLGGQELTSRTTLLGIYAAYAACLGQDLSSKRIFFHHIHHAERLGPYLKDFPKSKIICMTRDPRANFVSGILNWRQYNPKMDYQGHLSYYIHRIFQDADVLKDYRNSYVVIRLEDLGQRTILEQLCGWLGIDYDLCMTKSTWGGLLWHGDRLSTQKKDAAGFSKALLQNNWEKKLSRKDRYVLDYLMCTRLKYYGYPHREKTVLDALLVFFLIPFPLKFEWHYWSRAYIKRCFKNGEYKKMIRNGYDYAKRLLDFYRYYFKIVVKTDFNHSFLKSESGSGEELRGVHHENV